MFKGEMAVIQMVFSKESQGHIGGNKGQGCLFCFVMKARGRLWSDVLEGEDGCGEGGLGRIREIMSESFSVVGGHHGPIEVGLTERVLWRRGRCCSGSVG